MPILLVVVIAWIAVYAKMRTMKLTRAQDSSLTNAGEYSWRVLLSIAIAASFVTKPLRESFNQIIFEAFHFANLSQLIEGIASIAAGYNIALFAIQMSATRVDNAAKGKRIRQATLVLILAYLSHYYFYASQAPNMLGDVPSNLHALILKVVPYVYTGMLVMKPLQTYWQHLHKENNPLLKVRLRLWFIGSLSAAIFVIHMFFWMIIAYWDSGSPLLDWIIPTAVLALLGASMWMVGYLPGPVLRNVSAWIQRAQSLLYFLKLRAAAGAMDKFVRAPYDLEHISFWALLRDPEWHLHQEIIALLDQIKILLGWEDLPKFARNELERICTLVAEEDEILVLARVCCSLRLKERAWITTVAQNSTG